MKLVAVEGCILTADTGTGNISINTNASQKCKVDGKGIYSGTLNISITGLSGSGFTNGSGNGTLIGTGIYTSIDSQSVVLEGDKSTTITVTATMTAYPYSEITVPTIVTINSAGQTVLKAE